MKISFTALTAMLAVLPAALAAPVEAAEPGLSVRFPFAVAQRHSIVRTDMLFWKALEPRCVKKDSACKYGDHGCCGDLTCLASIHVTGSPGVCGHP